MRFGCLEANNFSLDGLEGDESLEIPWHYKTYVPRKGKLNGLHNKLESDATKDGFT